MAATNARRTLIAYSLGNFVFDSPRGLDKRLRQSFILRCTLSRRGLVAFEAVPVRLEATRPRLADGPEAQDILKRLDRLNAELNPK